MPEISRTPLDREPLHLVYAAVLLIAAIYILLPPHLAAISLISAVSAMVHYRAGLIWGFVFFTVMLAIAPMIWSVSIQIPRGLIQVSHEILLLICAGLTNVNNTGR